MIVAMTTYYIIYVDADSISHDVCVTFRYDSSQPSRQELPVHLWYSAKQRLTGVGSTWRSTMAKVTLGMSENPGSRQRVTW